MKDLFLLFLFLSVQAGALAQNGFCTNLLFRDTQAACITLSNPVCSCDSVTYDNDCIALKQHGVTGFVSGACNQITGPCNATAALAARFHLFAKHHAFHRQTQNLGDLSQVPIPDSLYQQALKAFVAVFQLWGNPARDQVFSYMTSFLHPFYRSPFNINIAVDTGQVWGKNLEAGILPCGEPLVDSLMARYQLLPDHFHFTFQNKRWIRLISPFALNTVGLANAFIGAQGLIVSEPGGSLFGDGDRTEIISWTYPMTIDFSYGWGDCPAGCIFRHYWRFQVEEDCQATFVQEWGDALPPVSTYTASPIHRFDVLGRPGSQEVKIKVELGAHNPFEIRVWNALGQLQSQRTYTAATLDETFDWRGAAPGLYLFELRTPQGRKVVKVLH